MLGNSNFENIYDKYCGMLYGISLQICNSNKNEAEELLISTFKKIHEQDICPEKFPSYCITLIRFVIKTAKELYPIKFKRNFKLKQFENTPLINQFMCDQITLQDYCKDKHLTLQEVLQIIRKEFAVIRTTQNENVFSTDNMISAENLLA